MVGLGQEGERRSKSESPGGLSCARDGCRCRSRGSPRLRRGGRLYPSYFQAKLCWHEVLFEQELGEIAQNIKRGLLLSQFHPHQLNSMASVFVVGVHHFDSCLQLPQCCQAGHGGQIPERAKVRISSLLWTLFHRIQSTLEPDFKLSDGYLFTPKSEFLWLRIHVMG